MLAERAMETHAILGCDLEVRDVARQWVAEIEVLSFAIAEAARREADDGVVGLDTNQLRQIDERQRSAGDREPIDDRVLLRRKLAHSIAEELLQRRGKLLESRFGALGARQHMMGLAVGDDLANLERAFFEQRIDHLEQEERIARHARHEIGAHLTNALTHAETRLDQAHLLFRQETVKLDAHDAFEHEPDAIVGPRSSPR